MMANFMSYFGGRKDTRQATRDAIVGLRQQLQMIEKKEEYLQKKIEEELAKARANAVSNKTAATAALKRKKASEAELDRLGSTRLQLELQVNTLESANLNTETMQVMKKAADALKQIHGNMTVDKVGDVMDEIHAEREVAMEISNAIAQNPYEDPAEADDLQKELEEMEEDVLNERLVKADHVPAHLPPNANKVTDSRHAVVEDDDEAQLRELQAQMTM